MQAADRAARPHPNFAVPQPRTAAQGHRALGLGAAALRLMAQSFRVGGRVEVLERVVVTGAQQCERS